MEETSLTASKNCLKADDNIGKVATGQGDDYTTGCLIDYPYF